MRITIFLTALFGGIITYLLSRKKPVQKTFNGYDKSHHLTKAFSKAKQHAVGHAVGESQ